MDTEIKKAPSHHIPAFLYRLELNTCLTRISLKMNRDHPFSECRLAFLGGPERDVETTVIGAMTEFAIWDE